jgi:glycerol transport system substrate-binding protein
VQSAERHPVCRGYPIEKAKEIDGVRIYGHMDYGKRAPDLGWRMTDAWLSMAGAGSKGLPNGRPVDEWGIRMEEGSCNPAGAAVSRGGAANGPAAVYAIRKWDEWLRKYAPPGAASYDFYQSLPALSQGNVVVTEISGSESVIHMRAGEDTGVSLSHGIHPPTN